MDVSDFALEVGIVCQRGFEYLVEVSDNTARTRALFYRSMHVPAFFARRASSRR